MTDHLKFLYDNQLNSELECLIQKAEKFLFLVSPYIDLAPKIKDALLLHIDKVDFKLCILFGKSEGNYFKTFNKNSFEFLSNFPNVDIRYNERLHAKYYENEFNYIITSMNLYNYSHANNIEIGVKGFISTKGMIAKVIEKPFELLGEGIDSIKSEIGFDIGKMPSQKFQEVFKTSRMIYKTEPITKSSKGIKGFIGLKELDGYNVVLNQFENDKFSFSNQPDFNIKTTSVYLSATKYSKLLNIDNKTFTLYMEEKGYIKNNTITQKGLDAGLKITEIEISDKKIIYIDYPVGFVDDLEIQSIN